jgi:hypothetical protein
MIAGATARRNKGLLQLPKGVLLMANRKEVAARAKRVVVQDELSAFDSPPLIEGEDAAADGDFLAGISAVVKPKDFVEVIFTRDVVDLTWETQRMRRLKAALMTSALSIGLRKLLAEALGEGARVDNLLKRWAARDHAAISEVDKVLASKGLTMEGVAARTLSDHIDTVERIDRIVTSAEGRRNATLRELERHRSAMAEALRRATDDVVDGEFEDVAPAARAPQGAPDHRGQLPQGYVSDEEEEWSGEEDDA